MVKNVSKVIYYLTWDINNTNELSNIEYLKKIGKVVLVTISTQPKNKYHLKQITITKQHIWNLWFLKVWMKIAYILSKSANTSTDLKFNERISVNNQILKSFIWLIWKFKTKIVNNFLPSYEDVALIPFFIKKTKKKEIKKERIIVHNALIIHMRELIYFYKYTKKLGLRHIAYIKSWDNPYYSQFCTKSDLYLVWSDLMIEDLEFVHGDINKKYLRWGGRYYKSFVEESTKKNTLDNPIYIGYAASFSDYYMAKQEVKLVEALSREINRANSTSKILYRPYPTLAMEIYLPLLHNKNVEVYEIKGEKNDRFGDKSEMFNFGSNEEKINYISNCKFLLTIGTSFAIEAAIMNKPIIPFILAKNNRFEDFENEIFKIFDINQHLSRYINILSEPIDSYNKFYELLKYGNYEKGLVVTEKLKKLVNVSAILDAAYDKNLDEIIP